MKITVITPSVRKEGLAIVDKALRRQTFTDFEWLVGSEEDFGYGLWVKDPGKNEGDYWSVFKAYNALVKKAKGELLVTWQDHTFANPDCLEKFWQHYLDEPKTIVTAVGNKYSDETFMVQTWKDPRERDDQGSYYSCNWNDIELNLASFPTKALYEVGGFDEYMDKHSSFCGLDVLHKLNFIGGYDFKIDQSIKSFSTEHGRPPMWEENIPNKNEYGIRVQELQKMGLFPRLPYLDK